MVVRSSCIPPVNTVPHGGQIIVHSTSQHIATCDQIIVHSTNYHSASWWSDHCAFHQSTYCHMIRSSCILPIITVQHGDQIIGIPPFNSPTRWSDRKQGSVEEKTARLSLLFRSGSIFLPSEVDRRSYCNSNCSNKSITLERTFAALDI